MSQEINEQTALEQSEPLPFPFNQRTFCPYETIEKRIETVRVLVIDDLLRDERDLSESAHAEWGASAKTHLARERHIASLAIENIVNNIKRLVREPETQVAHVSEIAEVAAEFRPQAIVLSGTLRDFDYYNPEIFESFERFIQTTQIPVLGICGGHQLIGMAFGANVLTLDNREPLERRDGRPFEYQYRFIRITAPNDPIFQGINDRESGVWQDYTTEARILRVWQNHGLQLDRIPEGFSLLATAYLCRTQMMVRRTGEQLIYTVQFHLEKSFEDWNKNRTRWEHLNESRDGRILFENFLREAIKRTTDDGQPTTG
ncbi:MAG TPA: gamma-glutamyl-gamma-aminobutyrate hydrolase family protein [Pyrinomonadaceae bacterium]|nr:gamma-glutamyl-gamma-aminobutyrate hydrolase family protein [Pyrinomonadaceae bacterium]